MDLTSALNRRAFLRLGASAAAASLAGCSLPGDRTTDEAAAKAGPVPLSGTEAFNYIVGTQTIGATYQFTQESVLVETAQAILDLGSNLLKFTLGRGYQRMMLKPSKAAYPETMQYLLNYTEVNHVSAVSMEGRPSVTNSVLPKTNVDYVSYSTYDSLDDIPNKIPRALDYIESKLPPKAGIAGKRVFIGEYGFAAHTYPEPERDRRSRQVMRIGLEWGCPFVLCWQMYNNEFSNGVENGYWLIDDHGVKQPLWHTLAGFYREARQYAADSKRHTGRLPAEADFRRFALTLLQ